MSPYWISITFVCIEKPYVKAMSFETNKCQYAFPFKNSENDLYDLVSFTLINNNKARQFNNDERFILLELSID